MTKSTFAKTKAQIKSYQYYLFWGACTFAVMAGQIFVGAGYQSMSNSVKDLTEIIESHFLDEHNLLMFLKKSID